MGREFPDIRQATHPVLPLCSSMAQHLWIAPLFKSRLPAAPSQGRSPEAGKAGRSVRLENGTAGVHLWPVLLCHQGGRGVNVSPCMS